MHEWGIEHQPDEHHTNIATTMSHTVAEAEEQRKMELTKGGCSRGERRLGFHHRHAVPLYAICEMPSVGPCNYTRWHGVMGNGACNSKKFLRSHNMEMYRYERGSVSTYPCRP
jgi:hypothetical protein